MNKAEALGDLHESFRTTVEFNGSDDGFYCSCHGCIGHCRCARIEENAGIETMLDTDIGKVGILCKISDSSPFA